MEQIKLFKQRPFILIDDELGEMLNCAVRYALGRRTYAAKDVCEFVRKVIPHLEYKTLFTMYGDIADCEDLGDDCDVKEWLSLKIAITKQIERMVEEAL